MTANAVFIVSIVSGEMQQMLQQAGAAATASRATTAAACTPSAACSHDTSHGCLAAVTRRSARRSSRRSRLRLAEPVTDWQRHFAVGTAGRASRVLLPTERCERARGEGDDAPSPVFGGASCQNGAVSVRAAGC